MSNLLKYLLLVLLAVMALSVQAQENAWENMLKKEVEVLNPNYKPVIGAGICWFDFRGDIKNKGSYPFIGNMGYKINIHTYLDPQRYVKANLYTYIGTMTVNQYSSSVDTANLNFRSDMVTFGANILYDFRNIFKKDQFITPFISLGAEYVYFNSKSDLKNNTGTYNYWPDGTIHDRAFPYNYGDVNSGLLHRDFDYETDLRRENEKQGFKKYSRGALAVPIEVGLDLFISNRSYLRLAMAYHYVFSDFIDNVAGSGTYIKGDSKNDAFVTSSITLHLDLFSDPKTRIQNLLFADVDFDYTMYSDEDGDMIFDGWDQCPGTPADIKVDTLGCPYDADKDGVFDYKDKQQNTRPAAIVDLSGVEITDDEVISFFTNHQGVKRSEVDYFLKLYNDQAPRSARRKLSDLPPKFKTVDLNKDGYISYEEVLKTIDSFYEFESILTYKDIEELIEFFFNQ